MPSPLTVVPTAGADAIAQDLLQEIDSAVALRDRVLTAPEGPYGDIRPDLRTYLALVETGEGQTELRVSGQHTSNAYVMAFMDRLDQRQIPFQVVQTTLSEIKALYQSTEGASAPGASLVSTSRQQDVIAIMGEAHRRGASDLHFVVGHEITRVMMRVHGLLTEYGQYESRIGRELCSALYNSMCDVAQEHYQPEISQDARVKRDYVEQLGLFGARVATRPLVDGPLMVLRLLYDDESKQSLDDLGFLPQQIEQFARLRSLPYGVNLITGPTGSGKSKTLQVTLNQIARETTGTRHILTVEDPPEYPLQANQSPLGNEESWDAAITNSMRLDPDILMYGEVRDLPSAKAAFRGGMTGHLVWSTLHTNNAVASLQRLIDMGADKSLVTDPALMTGVINQSLVPVLCQRCSVPAAEQESTLSPALVSRLKALTDFGSVRLQGPGCAHCRKLGVTTRTVVAEVLLPDHGFMRVFRETGAGEARNHWVRQMGGITKVQHTLSKVSAGLVDPRMAETIVGPLDFDQYVLERRDAE